MLHLSANTTVFEQLYRQFIVYYDMYKLYLCPFNAAGEIRDLTGAL